MQPSHATADAPRFLEQSIAALQALAADAALLDTLDRMATRTARLIGEGGKLLIAGNGGSAADAQHLAAEFVVRLVDDRAPLPALALTTDSSILTAAGNDYGFEEVFARQVRALGRAGDVLLAISTSGNSPNVLAAVAAARASGLATFGWTGESGGRMATGCDELIAAPARPTAIVQQLHITLAHMFCAKVERLCGGG